MVAGTEDDVVVEEIDGGGEVLPGDDELVEDVLVVVLVVVATVDVVEDVEGDVDVVVDTAVVVGHVGSAFGVPHQA